MFCQFQTFFAYYCVGSSKAKMDIGLQLHTPIFFGLSVCGQLFIAWRNGIEYLNEKRLQYIDSFIGQLCSRHTSNQVSFSIGQHFYVTTKNTKKRPFLYLFFLWHLKTSMTRNVLRHRIAFVKTRDSNIYLIIPWRYDKRPNRNLSKNRCNSKVLVKLRINLCPKEINNMYWLRIHEKRRNLTLNESYNGGS